MLTYNVHYNLAAWTNHSFILNERCSNAGNAYQCTTAGSSTSAPTGTGASINNGGVAVFKFLSTIDFTSLAAWSSSMVSTFSGTGLTDNLTALVGYNGVAISIAIGNTNLYSLFNIAANGHSILITAFPGQSFRDNGPTIPLAWNASNGVAFDMAAGAETGGTQYIFQTTDNITVKGLQFRDTNIPSGANFENFINMAGNNHIMMDCIIEGYNMVYVGGMANCGITNSLVVCRANTPLTLSFPIKWDIGCNGGFITNSTLICPYGNGGPAMFATSLAGANSVIVRDSTFFGVTQPIVSQNITGACKIDHCGFDTTSANTITSPPNGFPNTDSGGNIYGLSNTNQFINSTTDFRLKVGSALINAGTTDLIHNPSADDIFGSLRDTIWDIGANEFLTPQLAVFNVDPQMFKLFII